jgi:hypothetical protein
MRKSINNNTYYQAMKKACAELGIPSAHFVHLGRVLGSCEFEMNEDSSEDLRFLGNWDPKVQEQRYSTKVPMKIIRSKAGMTKANGLNYNPRTALIVPDSLRHQVFPWLKDARESFLADKTQSAECVTARCFLHLMDEMQTVAIQDAAAMALQDPERTRHGIFSLPVFQSPEFQEYMIRMKDHLAGSKAPYDTSLEQVLPGVQSRLDTLNSNVGLLKRYLHQLVQDSERHSTEIEALPHSVAQLNEHALATLLQRVLAAGSLAANPQGRQGQCDMVAAVRNGTKAPSAAITVGLEGQRFRGDGHKFPLTVSSARDIWNAWFGLGKYKDVPVPGGIAQMEADHHTDWRQGYTKAEKKKLSRYNMSVTYMLEELGDETDPAAIERYLDGMDELFVAKKSFLSPFETALRERSVNREKESAAEEAITAGDDVAGVAAAEGVFAVGM